MMQCDRTNHDRASPDSDAITQCWFASGVMPDGDLLIDPAMAPDGFGGDDRGDTVLNEESGSDPVRVEDEGRGGSVHHTQQNA